MAPGRPFRAQDDEFGTTVGLRPSAGQWDGLRRVSGGDSNWPRMGSKKPVKQKTNKMRKTLGGARDVPAGTPCWEIPTDALGRETGRRLLVHVDDRPLRVEPRRQPWRDVGAQALEHAAFEVGVVEHDPRTSLRQSGYRRAAERSQFRQGMLTCSASALVGTMRFLPRCLAGTTVEGPSPRSVSAGVGRYPVGLAISPYCRAPESVCSRDVAGPTPIRMARRK